MASIYGAILTGVIFGGVVSVCICLREIRDEIKRNRSSADER